MCEKKFGFGFGKNHGPFSKVNLHIVDFFGRFQTSSIERVDCTAIGMFFYLHEKLQPGPKVSPKIHFLLEPHEILCIDGSQSG